jgi:hypothetical protein
MKWRWVGFTKFPPADYHFNIATYISIITPPPRSVRYLIRQYIIT